ncbi:MAG: kelch repeat-containing protein, partial [Solirubrobacterales bacterium]
AAGGTGDPSSSAVAEIWNPATDAWTATASLAPRAFHTAVLLPGGDVLVAAGLAGGVPTKTAARFDGAAAAWSAAAPLATARVLHTMTLLPDGSVLVAGGLSGPASISSAEVYGP